MSYLLILLCSLQLVFADANTPEGEAYSKSLADLRASTLCQNGLTKECVEVYLKLRNEAIKKKGSVDFVATVAGASFHFIGEIELEFEGGRTIVGMKYQNDIAHEALNKFKNHFPSSDETLNGSRRWCQTVVAILAVTANELRGGKFSLESQAQKRTDLIEYYKKTRLKDGEVCPEALKLPSDLNGSVFPN
jgi:hypothetical protein